MIKFTISRNLIKDKDTIIETIKIFPYKTIIFDESRLVSLFVKNYFSFFSLFHLFELNEIIQDSNEVRITRYNYKDLNLKLNLYEEVSFKYQPWLGKKKCNKCFYSRILNKKTICYLRRKEIENGYYKNCSLFLEKSMIEKI